MSVFENLVGNEERPESKAGGALAKWGPQALGEGFVFLPRALVTRQKQLGLNSNELVVLLNLISSWWEEDDHPYPRAQTIASRMDTTSRSVLRHLQSLETKGFLRRFKGESNGQGARGPVTRYDLAGTVARLGAVALPAGPRLKDRSGQVFAGQDLREAQQLKNKE